MVQTALRGLCWKRDIGRSSAIGAVGVGMREENKDAKHSSTSSDETAPYMCI